MYRILSVLLIMSFFAAPVESQESENIALLQEFSAALLALEDLEYYTVTWEIDISEWIAFGEDGELIDGIDREIVSTTVDHYRVGEEHFTFQRNATITEERHHEDQIVTYSVEIRIVEGVNYVRVDVLKGKMVGSYPTNWAIWQYPDQWSALEDLLPHTYFAAVELNSPLPLFDLTAETITALTSEPADIQRNSWPWQDRAALQLSVHKSGILYASVLQTRPSFDLGDPYDLAVLNHLTPTASTQIILYHDREQPDRLMGITDDSFIETTRFSRQEFEDGAPDNLQLSLFYQRTSAIDLRDINAEFASINAPAVD